MTLDSPLLINDKKEIFCPWKKECGKPNAFVSRFAYQQHHRLVHGDKPMPHFTSFDHENYNSSTVLNYQDLNDYVSLGYI